MKIPGWPDGDAMPEVRVPSLAVVGARWAGVGSSSSGVTKVSLPRVVTTLEPGSRRFQWQTNWGAPILEALEKFSRRAPHASDSSRARASRLCSPAGRNDLAHARGRIHGRLRRRGGSIGHSVPALRVEAHRRASPLRRARRRADRVPLRKRFGRVDHALLHAGDERVDACFHDAARDRSMGSGVGRPAVRLALPASRWRGRTSGSWSCRPDTIRHFPPQRLVVTHARRREALSGRVVGQACGDRAATVVTRGHHALTMVTDVHFLSSRSLACMASVRVACRCRRGNCCRLRAAGALAADACGTGLVVPRRRGSTVREASTSE